MTLPIGIATGIITDDMADQKVEIKFHNSMVANKRNDDFAYLRKNVLSTDTPGLYPAKDFYLELPELGDSVDIVDIQGTDYGNFDIKIIVQDGTDSKFYHPGSNSESNSALANTVIQAAAFGEDGVYVATDGDEIYKLQHLNSNTTKQGDADGTFIVDVGGYDGLNYWWAGNNGIWKQPPGGNATQIFFTIGNPVEKIDFYNDQMILFLQEGADITVLFWDKADSALFQRRITVKNSQYIAGGVVDGTLMLVRAVGNSANTKETFGEMIVSAFDGRNFKRLNSIVVGDIEVGIQNSANNGCTSDTGSEIMVFSVLDNQNSHNPDLYQNYIYRVRTNGEIEALAIPNNTEASQQSAAIVRVLYDSELYATPSSSGVPWKVYMNRETDDTYENYTRYTTTEYITNFMANPYNDHKLDGLSVSFERLFKNEDYTPIPPVPGGSGAINVTDLAESSLTLNWTKATDETTPQNQLQYKAFFSTSNNITSVSDMETNGTAVGDWGTDINTIGVTGLTEFTPYWFNVMVKNAEGAIAAYSPVTATPDGTVVTEWRSPTATGEVTFASTPSTQWTNPTNAYAEDGSFATSADSKYQAYYDFGFSIPTGSSIMGIEIRLKGYSDPDPTTNAKFSISMTKLAGVNSGSTEWTDANGSATTSLLTNTNAVYTLGGNGSLFSTTWNEGEVEATSFGLIVRGTASSTPVDTEYFLDSVEVRVFYNEP